jgi:hypothetical protein
MNRMLFVVAATVLATVSVGASAMSHGGAMSDKDKAEKMEACKKMDPMKADEKMKAECKKLEEMSGKMMGDKKWKRRSSLSPARQGGPDGSVFFLCARRSIGVGICQSSPSFSPRGPKLKQSIRLTVAKGPLRSHAHVRWLNRAHRCGKAMGDSRVAVEWRAIGGRTRSVGRMRSVDRRLWRSSERLVSVENHRNDYAHHAQTAVSLGGAPKRDGSHSQQGAAGARGPRPASRDGPGP